MVELRLKTGQPVAIGLFRLEFKVSRRKFSARCLGSYQNVFSATWQSVAEVWVKVLKSRMEPSATERMDAQRPDEELENLAALRDFASAKELFARYYFKFKVHALGICKDEGLAEDAVQEAYLRFAFNFDDFRPPYKFAAWINGIIRNVIREEWKYRKKTGTGLVADDIGNIEDRSNETTGEKLDRKDFANFVEDLPKFLQDQHHQQIGELYREAFRNGQEPPSPDEIAKKVGISRRGVFRYRDAIERRWKRECAKRGFPPYFIDEILGKQKSEPV